MQHVPKRQDSLHLSKQHIAITLHFFMSVSCTKSFQFVKLLLHDILNLYSSGALLKYLALTRILS